MRVAKLPESVEETADERGAFLGDLENSVESLDDLSHSPLKASHLEVSAFWENKRVTKMFNSQIEKDGETARMETITNGSDEIRQTQSGSARVPRGRRRLLKDEIVPVLATILRISF